MFSFRKKPMVVAMAGVLLSSQALAQGDAVESRSIEVVSPTPLASIGLPLNEVPANVQVVRGEDLQHQHSLSIADYMNQNMVGVNINETQNNPFQPNVNFHGFTASPLLGTPQGLSVYQDGVRINEPFGDVVSWDLIPTNAIAGMSLMPGSNPLFGLNTLGGALSIITKRGYTHQGGAVELSGGSWGRSNAQAEYGGVADNGLDYFISGNYFDEDGWRDASPTRVKQMFGQVGWRDDKTDLSLTLSLADNKMIGNGYSTPEMLRGLGWDSVYTVPDATENKMAFVNFNGSRWIADEVLWSGNVYYRNSRTRTLNGDINDNVEAADYVPDCSLSGSPDTACGGALNRSRSKRLGYGFTTQLAFNQAVGGHKNQFIGGVGYDHGRTDFNQFSELGNLTASRGGHGVGIEDEESAVDLRGVSKTWSAFATDTFSITEKTHLTVSGRYNHTRVENRDRLIPDATDPESLTGDHSFNRFNPAIGLAFTPTEALSFYAGYNEGSRAPTAIELGCANPDQPCKLPNAMAGDPPLKMVVSRTMEAGARGKLGARLGYSANIYRTQNTDDIQFIASSSTGAGYFDNVGKTRRLGADFGLNGDIGNFRWFVGYSYVRATYETAFDLVDNTSETGDLIHVSKGDTIPGIPHHQLKFRGEWRALPNWVMGTNVVAFSDQYAHGNENNQYQGSGGKIAGYTVVNLDTRYYFGNTGWQVFGKVNNLFDREYYTGGMLGQTYYDRNGSFMGGDTEVSSLVAPGAPRAAWLGVRYEFGGRQSSKPVDMD
jgi:outer membrane receptor protein involved in Fe transport